MKSLYYIKNGLVMGRVCTKTSPAGSGFIWIPFTSARQPSRKIWPTPESAIAGRISGGKLIEAETFQHARALAEA